MAYREHASGLILAEEAMDSAAVERALKRRHPDLRLQGWPDQARDTIVWKVVLVRPGHPPDTVCVWQTERGEPLPLSSGILNMVDQLDKNTSSVYLNEDQRNAQQKAEEQKVFQDRQEALVEDWEMKHGRPILPRSQALRMSRDKRRAKGERI